MSNKYAELEGVDTNQLLFSGDDELAAKLRAIPGVIELSRRIDFKGLVGLDGQTMVFSGAGVDPLSDNIISSFDKLISGRRLASSDQWQVLIGHGMAQGLAAAPGSSLIVTTVMPQGGLNAADFEVCGITQSDSSDYDKYMLKVPLSVAQKLLNTRKISKIVLLLDSTEITAQVKKQVQAMLAKDAPDLVIRDWRELNPQYDKIVDLYSRIFGFMAGSLILLSLLSIGNVMSMSFLERIREFSVMRAIGLGKFSLTGILLAEGILLALIACGAGVLMSLCLGWGVSATGGISMPPPPGSERGFPMMLHVDSTSIAVVLAGSVLVGMFSCALVAWRAARLHPALGLRHG